MLEDTVVNVLDPLSVVVGFCALGFTQCLRALNGAHIPVTCLHGDHLYNSCRGFHSVVLQVIVDNHGAFMQVKTNLLGSTHDVHVFWTASLLGLVESDHLP